MDTINSATGLHRLGLYANPFEISDDRSADSVGTRLAVQAASAHALGKIAESVSDPNHTPVVIEKSLDVPNTYHVRALAPVIGMLSEGEPVPGVLPLYVPLDMMKVGRVRAVLHALAERTAGLKPDVTLGQWARRSLEAADASLPEWQTLLDTGVDIEALIAEAQEDAGAFGRRVFGEIVQSREGAEDLEMLMRVAGSRLDKLDTDPAEGEEGMGESEDNPEDNLAEVFTHSLVEDVPEALPASAEADDAGAVERKSTEALREYAAAYAKATLSPVLARGIRAYTAQGTASMAQELKISKAPTKTVVALLDFLSERYRSAVIIYDRLDVWDQVPQDLRLKIMRTFSELRWALKERASIVLMLAPGTAPEIEEAFAAARRVSWDFSEAKDVYEPDAPYRRDIAEKWLRSASTDSELPEWGAPLLDAVPDGAVLADAMSALASAISVAAQSTDRTPDPGALR